MSHPSLIPVLERLGVVIGVGDDNVEAVCKRKGIDLRFFLSVVNTFLDEQYFPANPRDTFSLEKTIDYLEKTDAYYLGSQLPNIERHFDSLCKKSGGDNNLDMLLNFFNDVAAQLRESVKKGHRERIEAYTEVEEKLHDLLYFFVAHLHGSYDHNLCVAVVTAIFSLERDISQNNRIRRRILLPLIKQSESLNQ
ncbi:MAG: helix-turn-helix transcriptional regulator [Muribaculaceae bacterium]|nr:helix-turn-helix transcriptional regulator [Muribaculaceae bacterium]